MDWAEGGVLVLTAPFLLFPTVKPLWTAAALVVILLTWLARGILTKSPWPQTPLNGALLVWSVMVGVGVLVTAMPELTLAKATGLFLGIAVWRYCVYFLRAPGRLRWMTLGFLLLGLALTALGVLTTNWPSKIPFLQTLLAYLPKRLLALPEASAAGVHANQLGGTVVFYFPFVLSLFGGRPPRRRWLWRLGIACATLGIAGLLALTQSRSAWLGMWGGALALLLLWALMPLAKSPRRWLLAAAAGLLLLAMVGTWLIGPERLQRLIEEPSGMTALGSLTSLNFRYEVWRWALAAVQDFPFTGCGLGTFRQVVRLLYPVNVTPTYDIAHAHNIFLQVALDVGLPGLIAYLALLALAILSGLQTALRNTQLRAPALGLTAGLAALHIYGLMDALAPGSKPGVIFWYALGMLTALAQLPCAPHTPSDPQALPI